MLLVSCDLTPYPHALFFAKRIAALVIEKLDVYGSSVNYSQRFRSYHTLKVDNPDVNTPRQL